MHLSNHWSFNILNDPKRLAFVLARYSFVKNFSNPEGRFLELGCSEGIGVRNACGTKFKEYLGVDMDENAINYANFNLGSKQINFICEDFLGKTYGEAFDTVLSLDVVEHISPEIEELFFSTLHMNTKKEGIAIVGTPSLESQAYASAPSKAGHVNIFDYARLKKTMEMYFHNVFVFGINDELVHVGFPQMRQYLISLGCNKK